MAPGVAQFSVIVVLHLFYFFFFGLFFGGIPITWGLFCNFSTLYKSNHFDSNASLTAFSLTSSSSSIFIFIFFMDLSVQVKMAKSIVAIILVQFREDNHVINPIISFVLGVFVRALNQFLNAALKTGGWKVAAGERLIGGASFFLGGVFRLTIGLLKKDLSFRTILGTIMIFFLASVYTWKPVLDRAMKILVWKTLGVIFISPVLIMFLGWLRQVKLIREDEETERSSLHFLLPFTITICFCFIHSLNLLSNLFHIIYVYFFFVVSIILQMFTNLSHIF